MQNKQSMDLKTVDELQEDLDFARGWLVETHMKVAELLRDPGLRYDAVRRPGDDAMHPDEVGRYARIAGSALSRMALDEDACLSLPTDLRSLELLAQLTAPQLEELDRRVYLPHLCPSEIEREVRAIQANATGNQFKACADCQVRREVARIKSSIMQAIEDLPDGPSQDRLLDNLETALTVIRDARHTM